MYDSQLKGNPVLVPYRVMQELARLLKTKPDLQTKIATTKAAIEEGRAKGILEFRRDQSDDDVICDAVISRVAEQVLPRRNVLVLTHDQKLSEYLHTKTSNGCFSTKELHTAGINRQGELFIWPNPSDSARTGSPSRAG